MKWVKCGRGKGDKKVGSIKKRLSNNKAKREKSLRTPLIILFISVVLLPVTIITLLLYREMNDLVTNRVIREQQEATRSLIRLFSDTQQEAEATISVIQESLYLSEIGNETEETYLEETLTMLRDSGQFIEDVYVYNSGEHIVGTTDAYWISAQAQYWAEDALSYPGELIWTEPYMDNRTGNQTQAALLYVNDEVGIIGVSLDFEEIAREVDSTTIGYSGFAFVYSQGGYQHFTHQEENAGRFVRNEPLFMHATEEQGLLYDELNNQNFPIYYEQIPDLNLIVYGAVGEEELDIERSEFISNMLKVLGGSLVVASFIAFCLAKYLVKVTKVIQKALAKVQEGDLTTRILSYDLPGGFLRKTPEVSAQGNELARIASSFNETVARFSDMLKENHQLQLTSETDHLTGLPNLRSFEQMVEEYHALNPEESRSMVVLDLDHFKSINDTYGHEAGNEVLRQFSDLLREFVEKEGQIARFGGEEFIIFLPLYDRDRAAVFAERLRQKITKEPFLCHNYLKEKKEVWIEVTASIGVAAYPDGEGKTKPKELISQADKAMYVGSKRNGRNKVTTYSCELS